MPYIYNPFTNSLDYYETASSISGTISDHGQLTGLSNDDHPQYHTDARGDIRYYTKTILNAGQLDSRYYTETEVDTISGSLQTNIDGRDNYSSWNFAIDGVTKDAITSGDVLNFVSGDNITVTRSADDEITISGGAGGGTSNHSELNELDYASAGHTGFQPAGDYATTAKLTTTSGDLQTNIDSKSDTGHTHTEIDVTDLDKYTQTEINTISGALSTEIDSDISTHKTNFIDGPLSPQRLTGFTLSSGTNNGTGKVTAGTVLLRTTDSESGVLEYFSVNEHDNITITTSGTCYRVILQYNSGSPQIILQEAMPNYTTDITLGKFWREPDNTVHYKNTGRRLNNGVAKLHKRAEHIRPWEMCTSVQIADESSKLWSIAAGHFYKGINEFEFSKFDTSDTSVFTYVYYDGANWVYVANQTEINVDQYNNITSGLATCNKYKCDWVFVHPDCGHIYVVYGQDNNVVGVIEASIVPNVPNLVDTFGTLIGRIIINGGVDVFEEIEMVQTTTFNTTTVAVHNDLSGINGGTADERYHLTSAQHSDLTDSGDCSIHTHNDRYYTESEVDTISGTLQPIKIEAEPSSDHTANGPQCNTINAGESITVMDCVYLKSDGEWWKTSASGEATGAGMLAISLESKTDGQAMNIALSNTFIRNDSWTWDMNKNSRILYLSCTSGGLTQTVVSGTDNIVRIVGHATHTNRMFFNPEQTVVIHN